MNGTFNGQILVDKLAKLNNSQQSIETLSHWCIFHRKKAKQVVETWERQFHCSPRDQRLSFLYLANDILQNSRRKGSEFVTEFWKVLPDTLNDVIQNGDEFGRNAALRLIDIWEERKVFGSRGQILKEELLGRSVESKSRNGKSDGTNLKPSVGAALEKIIASYEMVYDGPVDEDAVVAKCRSAISTVEKVEKDVGIDYSSGNLSPFLQELQGQQQILRECIEQLTSAESARVVLVSHLKGALQDQEIKLQELRSQLQTAQSRFDRADSLCQQIMASKNGQLLSEQKPPVAPTTYANLHPTYVPESTPVVLASEKKEQSAQPVVYTQKLSSMDSLLPSEEDHRKSTAAAVAAKLAASTSSAQMLSYVLSSLASEGVIRNPLNEASSMEFPSEKRPKLENGPPASYIPTPINPPPPNYPHPDSLHPISSMSSPHQLPSHSSPVSPAASTVQQPPPPPALPPLQPPAHLGHFVQTAGPMTNVPYGYGAASQRPPSLPGYPTLLTPMSGGSSYPTAPNPFQNLQPPESGFFNQATLSTPPLSRQ